MRTPHFLIMCCFNHRCGKAAFVSCKECSFVFSYFPTFLKVLCYSLGSLPFLHHIQDSAAHFDYFFCFPILHPIVHVIGVVFGYLLDAFVYFKIIKRYYRRFIVFCRRFYIFVICWWILCTV